MKTIEELKQVGWWKKGEQYRYSLGMGLDGMIYYRTKRQVLTNSRTVTAKHPDYDKWFHKAEYLGIEMPDEVKQSIK